MAEARPLGWCPSYPHAGPLSIHYVPGSLEILTPHPIILEVGLWKIQPDILDPPTGSANKEDYLVGWGITAVECLNLMFPESLKVSTSELSSRFRRRGQGQLPLPTWRRGLAAVHFVNGRRFAYKSQHEQRLTYTPWRADGAQRCFQVPGLGGNAGAVLKDEQRKDTLPHEPVTSDREQQGKGTIWALVAVGLGTEEDERTSLVCFCFKAKPWHSSL